MAFLLMSLTHHKSLKSIEFRFTGGKGRLLSINLLAGIAAYSLALKTTGSLVGRRSVVGGFLNCKAMLWYPLKL